MSQESYDLREGSAVPLIQGKVSSPPRTASRQHDARPAQAENSSGRQKTLRSSSRVKPQPQSKAIAKLLSYATNDTELLYMKQFLESDLYNASVFEENIFALKAKIATHMYKSNCDTFRLARGLSEKVFVPKVYLNNKKGSVERVLDAGTQGIHWAAGHEEFHDMLFKYGSFAIKTPEGHEVVMDKAKFCLKDWRFPPGSEIVLTGYNAPALCQQPANQTATTRQSRLTKSAHQQGVENTGSTPSAVSHGAAGHSGETIYPEGTKIVGSTVADNTTIPANEQNQQVSFSKQSAPDGRNEPTTEVCPARKARRDCSPKSPKPSRVPRVSLSPNGNIRDDHTAEARPDRPAKKARRDRPSKSPKQSNVPCASSSLQGNIQDVKSPLLSGDIAQESKEDQANPPPATVANDRKAAVQTFVKSLGIFLFEEETHIYVSSLCKMGFHPQCPSRVHVNARHLNPFMLALHQRSFLLHIMDHASEGVALRKSDVQDKNYETSRRGHVKAFLDSLGLILEADESETYVDNLCSLGFHPHCSTCNDLKESHLASFMRPLHRLHLLEALRGWGTAQVSNAAFGRNDHYRR